VSSSEIDEVLNLSHRILFMRQGKIVKEFTQEEVNKSEVMQYVSGSINDHKKNKIIHEEVQNG
jgi:ABC-type sugar transport system ATPase subunit